MGKFHSAVYSNRVGYSFTEQSVDVNGVCFVGFHFFHGVVSVNLVFFQSFCYGRFYKAGIVIGNQFFEPCGMVCTDSTVEHRFGADGMRSTACHYQTGWRTMVSVLVETKVAMSQFAIGIVCLTFPE